MLEATQRRLTAIVSADVVGYSSLMQADEAGTLARLKERYQNIVAPKIGKYGGRVVKLMGDGLLAEFPSVVNATEWALEIQTEIAAANAGEKPESRILYRIGVNLGDVIFDDDDIYGDGVNRAARMQEICEPGGVCISDDAFRQVRGKVDTALTDGGEVSLKNISGQIRIWRWSPSSAGPERLERPSLTETLTPLDKPSIAVLPFENLSDEREQEYFADGIAEDIISGLSRTRGFFVIARNSSFTYKGRPSDVTEVGRDLGVRYVLEGSVRKVGSRVRIAAQLIETKTRNHVWAESYDRDLDDIFVVQDEITQAIVAAVEPELGGFERERALRLLPDSLDVWGLYQRGLWHIYQFTKQDQLEALKLFEQACDRDTKFGPAFAGLSFAYFLSVYLGYSSAPEIDLIACYDAAKKSVACDEKDPVAHWALARAHLLRGEHDLAIVEFETSIELNPSFAQGYYNLGWALVQAGRPNEALPHLDKAYRLSPHDPLVFAFMNVRSMALVLMGDPEQAHAWAQKAIRQSHAHYHTFAIAAACAALAHRESEAKRVVEELLRQRPDYTCTFFAQSYPFRRPEDLKAMTDGLRKAGLPE